MTPKRLAVIPFLVLAACGHENIAPADGADHVIRVHLDGQPATLTLQRTMPAVSPEFARYRVEHGRLMRVGGLETLDLSCYYRGTVDGRDSEFIVKTCSGSTKDLRGVGVMDGEWFEVRGNTMTAAALDAGRCGTEHTNLAPPAEVPSVEDDTVTTRQALSTGTPRFAELALFQDDAMYEGRADGRDLPDPVLAVHAVSMLYDQTVFDDRVLPLLTVLVDTQGENPWGNPSNFGFGIYVSGYLNSFDNWLENSANLPDFDQATLLTGYDMQGSTVGLATVGGACDLGRSGAVVHANRSLANVSQTIAHELGHSLGMVHDGSQGNNNCDSSAYVMRAVINNGVVPTEFSTCSIEQGNEFFGSSDSSCLTPDAAPAAPEPLCGDGKVDIGEACDCGPLGCAGRDACCDETTCQLKAGATCSQNDGCCDTNTCQPFAAADAVECRPASSDCDVPEVCDGNAACPVDIVIPTGSECVDDSGWQGSCWQGDCQTRGGVCEEIAPLYRFDDPPYAEMCGDGGGCGVIDCLANGYCVLTEHSTPDGIACADGSQCFEGQCVPSGTLPGADGCAEPWRDTDQDGTRDCDDACPNDPAATTTPCETVVTPDPNNPDAGGSSDDTGGGGPGDEPDSGRPGQPSVNPTPTAGKDGGCSTAAAGDSLWGLVLALVFVGRRR